jgi:hypothetical protein
MKLGKQRGAISSMAFSRGQGHEPNDQIPTTPSMYLYNIILQLHHASSVPTSLNASALEFRLHCAFCIVTARLPIAAGAPMQKGFLFGGARYLTCIHAARRSHPTLTPVLISHVLTLQPRYPRLTWHI